MNDGHIGHNTSIVLCNAEIPVVSTWPAVQKFVTGSTVTIACTAVSYPPATFAWRYGDSGQIVENGKDERGRGDIPVETWTDSGRVSTDHEGLLTIRNATMDDAGRWECIATNDLGVGSDVALLEYIGIPFIFDTIRYDYNIVLVKSIGRNI